MTYDKTCRQCKEVTYFEITDKQLDRLQKGEHIQNVLPHLSADDRELLISGICGKCFDNMFA